MAAALLERSEDGMAWSGQAVLARTHDQLATVAHALTRAGIPHRMAPGPEAPEGETVVPREDGPRRGGSRRSTGVLRTEGRGRSDDAVELATFHRAKGLEWESVHVVGLEEGFVPIVYAESSEALDEERRLLYVALTRAARDLHCSWARSRRMANGRQMDRRPSPWLADGGPCLPGRLRTRTPAGHRPVDRRDAGRPRALSVALPGRALRSRDSSRCR